MVNEISAELAVGEIPDLDKLIPATRNDERVLSGWGESYAGDPFGMTLIMNCVLAFAKSIPELDGFVSRTRYDLTVIGGESYGEDVLGMAHKATGGLTGVEIPQTKCVVP